jgi:predicted nucleic acid-binding protein
LARSKFLIDPAKIAASLGLIEKSSMRVRPEHKAAAAKDPDDNKFLECTAEARVDYLVTGNKRHFPAQWGKTRVVNGRELLEAITPDLKR